MATRIYKVTSKSSGSHLVRATTRSQAIAHIAQYDINATVASQDDIVQLLNDGRIVIDIKGNE